MTNTETLSTTALDVQAIRKKLEKHFSDLPAAELDTDECRRLFIVRRLLRHAYSLCVRGDVLTKPTRSRTPLSGSTTSHMTSNLRNEP